MLRCTWHRITKQNLVKRAQLLAEKMNLRAYFPSCGGDFLYVPTMRFLHFFCRRHGITWRSHTRKTCKITVAAMECRVALWLAFVRKVLGIVADHLVYTLDENCARPDKKMSGNLEIRGMEAIGG